MNFGRRPSAGEPVEHRLQLVDRHPVGVDLDLHDVGLVGAERRHRSRVGRRLGDDHVARVDQRLADEVDHLLAAGRDDHVRRVDRRCPRRPSPRRCSRRSPPSPRSGRTAARAPSTRPRPGTSASRRARARTCSCRAARRRARSRRGVRSAPSSRASPSFSSRACAPRTAPRSARARARSRDPAARLRSADRSIHFPRLYSRHACEPCAGTTALTFGCVGYRHGASQR